MLKYGTIWMVFFGLVAVAALDGAPQQRPNVLVIMADDQGSGDIGYNNPRVKSPTIDRLATQSAVFTDFVSCPACTPARASYLTGRNYMSTGVWGVGPRGYINRDETFLPAYLGKAGYCTGHFGKWGEGWTPDQRPYMRGYDTAYAFGAYQHKDPWIDHNGTLVHEKGWTADILADHTIEFVREQTAAKKPWYAITAYISPHAPWECDPKYSDPYEKEGHSKALASLWGMVSQMDEATGRILAELDRLGIANNTIVIYVSDNGASPNAGHPLGTPVDGKDWALRNPLHLRGQKATAWENGIRVPFFIRWPGHIPVGTRPQTASIEDILPTILDLADVAPSIVPGHLPLDGRSFKEILFQPDAPTTDRLIFTMPVAYDGAVPSWPKLIIENPQDMRYDEVHTAVYGPRFKYHCLPHGKEALYDIKDDPGETTDVSAQHPETAQQMAEACRRDWDSLLKSDRCFRMPAFLIGDPRYEGMKRCWAYIPPDTIAGNAAQKVAGTVTCPFQGATGFAHAGDSVTYAMDVRTTGAYRISIKGTGLDHCAPLIVEIGGRKLSPKKTTGEGIEFGEIELGKGSTNLRVTAVTAATSGADAQPATVQEIAVIPVVR